MERIIKDFMEEMFFGMLYYIVKCLNVACIGALLWIFLSWVEIAFTLKQPGVIPEYSAWNFFYLF